MSGRWLAWAQRIRAIAQTGHSYSKDAFDLERYSELRAMSNEMLGALIDEKPARLEGYFLEERGYPTPKLDCRAGVFRDGKILLAREVTDQRWSLPGGWVDEHDAPSAAVEREVFEETGFRVKATRFVALKDRRAHPYEGNHLHRIYKLFFLCELVGGSKKTSIETTDVGFFEIGQLPELSLTRVIEEDIEMLNRFRQEPAATAYFD